MIFFLNLRNTFLLKLDFPKRFIFHVAEINIQSKAVPFTTEKKYYYR